MTGAATDEEQCLPDDCKAMIKPVRDSLEALGGRWRLPILVSLYFGKKRFKEISKDVSGITDKVLSHELKELEANKLIQREVLDTFPPTIEYSITLHGETVKNLMVELYNWGLEHRKVVIER